MSEYGWCPNPKITVFRYYTSGNYYGGSSTNYCNNDNDCTGNLKCCYSYGQQQCTYPHYSGGVGSSNVGIGFGHLWLIKIENMFFKYWSI